MAFDNKIVHIEFDNEDYELLKIAAEVNNCDSISEYIRKLLADKLYIKYSNKKFTD